MKNRPQKPRAMAINAEDIAVGGSRKFVKLFGSTVKSRHPSNQCQSGHPFWKSGTKIVPYVGGTKGVVQWT